MTTPLESIENTVTRLRVKVGPHGWHAGEIDKIRYRLEQAREALRQDKEDLIAWEKILDTLRADKADLEQFKEEFLRRHHSELVPHDGVSLYTIEKTAGGFGVLKSDNPITKAEANGYDVHDFDKKES